MRVRALFIGLPRGRVRRILASIEEASEIGLVSSQVRSEDEVAGPLKGSDAVFISRDQEEKRLTFLLEEIRKREPNLPVVLVYESEPDGKAFLLANRYDCWLFSEEDDLNRTLTPSEIGQALAECAANGAIEQRLFEVSMSAGPCSTGG